MMSEPEKTTAEQPNVARRGFPAGVSGNPAGRPKGSRNKTTLAIEALLEGEAEALTRKAIERALEGDMAALRLCMDRLAPPRAVIGLRRSTCRHLKKPPMPAMPLPRSCAP
jgi:hypothetical protein